MKTLDSCTIQQKTGCGTLYAHFHHDDKLRHVGINLGRSGSCPYAFLKSITALINIALKHNTEMDELIECFKNIHCSKTVEDEGKVYSCIDAISRCLKKYNVKNV